MKVYFQGVKGAYSDEAVFELASKIGLDFESAESLDFVDLFKNIEEYGLGLVPIENSNAGSVSSAVDLLRKYEFEILGEYFFDVNHALLVNEGVELGDVKKVYSHPQALSQCSKFLNDEQIEAVSFTDTAGSAKYIAENNLKDIAAIGSEKLSSVYGLKILKKGFQNSRDNVTRFLLIKNKKKDFAFEADLKKNPGDSKTTLIFETRNIPGALYKAIGGFVTNGINLTRIESRPSGIENFEYFFYLEFNGNLDDENVKNAMEELRFFSKKVQIYGSYKNLSL